MPGEKHPIIAHGELYVEPIVKKSRPIDKSIPHEYEDAKQRILSDISNITEKIEIQEEFFLDEKILCVRMEPKFEAKSLFSISNIYICVDIFVDITVDNVHTQRRKLWRTFSLVFLLRGVICFASDKIFVVGQNKCAVHILVD